MFTYAAQVNTTASNVHFVQPIFFDVSLDVLVDVERLLLENVLHSIERVVRARARWRKAEPDLSIT